MKKIEIVLGNKVFPADLNDTTTAGSIYAETSGAMRYTSEYLSAQGTKAPAGGRGR
ncbi:hypothetical protein M1N81_02400 [Dehalococcoidia bacterium]|nr:hypothetical protein [Dehalococcoidia bacterium]